jgi:hypothetical protein
MLIIFFDIREIVHRPTVNSAYYCDFYSDYVEDFANNFDDKSGSYIKITHHQFLLFTRELFAKNNMAAIPHPPYCSVSLIADTNERLSQAVLNTLTEHDFQDAFTEWQKHWGRCVRPGGDYFQGDGGQ